MASGDVCVGDELKKLLDLTILLDVVARRVHAVFRRGHPAINETAVDPIAAPVRISA